MKKKERKEKSKLRKIIEWIATGILIVLVAGCSFVLIYSKVNTKSDNPYAPVAIGNTYLPLVVKTDSMEPKYHVNTAIFVTKQSPDDIYKEYLQMASEGEDTKIEIDVTFDDNYRVLQHDLTLQDYAVLQSFGKNDRTTFDEPARTMTHRLFYMKINDGVEYGNGKYYFFVSGINTSSQHQSQQNQYQIFTENELYGRVTGNSDFLGGVFTFATSAWGLVILLLIPCLYMIISSVYDLIKSEEEKSEAITSSGEKIQLTEDDKKRLKQELLQKMIEEKQKEKLEKESKKEEESKDA